MISVCYEGGSRKTDFLKVKRTDIAGHANCYALIGVDQYGRKGGRQKRRLLHGSGIVIYKVDGIFLQTIENQNCTVVKAGFSITGGSVLHVPGINPAKVTFGVNPGMNQRTVPSGQSHHRLINCLISVRIQCHGLAYNISRFRSRRIQQFHPVHGIEQLAVGRLKPVDLRDRTRYYHTHGVGHVVIEKGIGYRLPERAIV